MVSCGVLWVAQQCSHCSFLDIRATGKMPSRKKRRVPPFDPNYGLAMQPMMGMPGWNMMAGHLGLVQWFRVVICVAMCG